MNEGGRGGEGRGEPRNAHLLRPTQKPPQPPPPGAAAAALQHPPAFPSPPPAPPPASPELSAAQTSPPGPAGPAAPSPHAPRTLSNPLGSRRLLREETLAAAGAARLGAGRRRGARYGEPRNEARAGAQRRRVLAEHGRVAAAAVAAGAQGPLHHWQPWSPSIFLPQGRRLGSAHVLGEEGAGARGSPEGGGTCAGAEGCAPRLSSSPQPARLHPAAPAAQAAAAAAPFSAALVARRAGAATAADAVQRNESCQRFNDQQYVNTNTSK
ncbi:uncharacterized protein LOC126057991 [Elephas maximus indicus]|uniref:uncharacterized protein LOC126057991 n=1 Tax=Elephas maximus indicus TaxID=99487 RepID=UPI00211681A3|nr:uncharacterized protein LOC126057991 [Elephas maximus indicus]